MSMADDTQVRLKRKDTDELFDKLDEIDEDISELQEMSRSQMHGYELGLSQKVEELKDKRLKVVMELKVRGEL